jgi:DNA-binding beta-propeller fold protein YncE
MPHRVFKGRINNTLTQSVTRDIPVLPGPAGVAVDSEGRFVYVASLFRNALVVVSTINFRVVDIIPVGNVPHHVATHPTENWIYAVNFGENSVSVVDGNSRCQWPIKLTQ